MDAVLGALCRAADSGLIPPGNAVLLAVSGGADSLALLYGSAEARHATRWALSVAHVHHGWRGRDADRDLAFVRDHARRLGISFFFRRCDARGAARARKLSPEAAARHVRYEALREMAMEAGASWIATAHQADDRLESYWLARERRGGLAALAGPRRRRLDRVVRPLLDVSRAEILEFLSRRGLAFRRDSTNGDLRLSRNRIRRALARDRSPESHGTRENLLAELDRLERERDRLDDELARRILPRASRGPGSVAVDAEWLTGESDALARRALEKLAAPFGVPGHAPLTGREREQILRRLAHGGDFRFEAGRRIAVERRGSILTLRLRESPAPVYHRSTSSA